MNYASLRSFLFAFPPEMAHAFVLRSLSFIPSFCFKRIPSNPVKAMGLTFPHRVGLAAGFDKNGSYVKGLQKLGFAFIEVGTVTPVAQWGNPKPRLFRLPEYHALINRMGFNNRGIEACFQTLLHTSYQGILGVNIGKNKATPLSQAAQDYVACYKKIYALADYVTLNVSSPNTPELRSLQQGDYLVSLLSQLQETQKALADKHQRMVPLVVKCSPDESAESLKQLAQAALAHGISGIIATNTTVSRPGLEGVPGATEAGGLSGRPLCAISTEALRVLKSEVGDAVTLIASGGIDSEAAAREKLAAGATLLQVYTGLIYQGPRFVSELSEVEY